MPWYVCGSHRAAIESAFSVESPRGSQGFHEGHQAWLQAASLLSTLLPALVALLGLNVHSLWGPDVPDAGQDLGLSGGGGGHFCRSLHGNPPVCQFCGSHTMVAGF